MEIRQATPDDAAALLTLVAQYWDFEGPRGFHPETARPQLTHLLGSPTLGAVWIATDELLPVAYLIVVYVFRFEHPGMTAEIDEFFVVPAHRASGVGSQLLREAEAGALRQGCTNISLQVAASNSGAMAFYGRNGYAARSGFRLLEKDLVAD